jgi:Excalibur calcium-binding domain
VVPGVEVCHDGAVGERPNRLSAFVAVAAVVVAFALAGTASAVVASYKNCAQLNARYPHGVGKVGARDHVTSGTPVTTFKRSNSLYAAAMRNNKGLDRDKDGVACETA